MNKIANELLDINEMFLKNNCNGEVKSKNNFYFYKGNLPILLSAPHAVKQMRNNQIKKSDYLTGPLTMYIASICNCSYIVRTYNNDDDPNYPLGFTEDKITNNYLKFLVDVVKELKEVLVIDMHGCKDSRIFDCSFWTEKCDPNMLRIFMDNLNIVNFSTNNGSEFFGGQVTRQASLITNAIQLEVKKRIRSLENENLLSLFIDSMVKSIYETYDYSLSFRRKILKKISLCYNKY